MQFDAAHMDLGRLDRLATMDSPVHRLDPRAKLATTLVFVAVVVSFAPNQLAALMPMALFPIALLAMGRLPTGFLFRKVLFVSPFAIMIGLFNPIIDRHTVLEICGLPISGGWISFSSILARFVLTVLAALVLIACTGFDAVCMALRRLHAPQAFTTQLMLLYRYLFVLMEETGRLLRAYAMRAPQGSGIGWKAYASLAGLLLLRTLDRAQRIHAAMLCRGFSGEIHMVRRLRLRASDYAFFLFWTAYFLLARLYNLPQRAGELAIGLFS